MKDQKEQKKSISDEVMITIVNYTDMITRGIISFLFIGVILTIILVGIFNVSYIWVFPIIFIISIIVSPLLSKIKVGHKIWSSYLNFLERFINGKDEKNM